LNGEVHCWRSGVESPPGHGVSCGCHREVGLRRRKPCV
jgi:hypothetical protein